MSVEILDLKFRTNADMQLKYFSFFLDAPFLGQSRAAACMQHLRELNADVKADYVDESVEFLLENRPTFFQSFDVVIASNLSEQSLLKLSNCLWGSNIPLIYCRSLGFLGSIRLQIKEHCVVESHPDNRQNDLRLEQPFEALKKHLAVSCGWSLVVLIFFTICFTCRQQKSQIKCLGF